MLRTTFSPRMRRNTFTPGELGGGDVTFETRQGSIVRGRLFRLDRIFSGPLPSDSVQAHSAVRHRILC